MNIYSEFCMIINDTFFKEEYKGGFVSFIVDDNFISKVCDDLHVDTSSLYGSVKSYMRNCFFNDINDIDFMGIFIIQLYAASLRENKDSYTTASYRTHLCSLLSININDLNEWMKYCQDDLWRHLYKWCDNNGFIIKKFKSRPGPWKYVNYILQLSDNTFTYEDMKYFGYNFNQYGLCPNEEISEFDFWRIIDKNLFKGYTRHSELVLNNILVDESICSQIYNYYLKWDGSYIEPKIDNSKSTPSLDKYQLYLSNDLHTIEIRDESLAKILDFDITELPYHNISKFYKQKHKGIILLRKNEFYDDMFEEVRYLDDDEVGIVIIFTNCLQKHFQYEKIKRYSGVLLAKIERNETTEFLYSTKKPFKLVGGLKLSRNIYIYGGPPILKISGKISFWLDGKAYEAKDDQDTYLPNLCIGKHLLKFKGFSPLKFDVVNASYKQTDWKQTYKQWNVQNLAKKIFWNPVTIADSSQVNNILGIDFSRLPLIKNKESSVIKRWIYAHHYTIAKNENNFIIHSIINTNEYGKK